MLARACSVASRMVLLPLQPRGLSRGDAAAYLGLSVEGFDQWVRKNIVPGPLPGTQRWDRRAIDVALDRASGIRIPLGAGLRLRALEEQP